MTENYFGRTLYPLGLCVWLVVFGLQLGRIGRLAWALSQTVERTDDDVRALETGAQRLKQLTLGYVDRSSDVRQIEALPDILPEDKGYLRTQNAIAGEVALLRAKVARRLRGALHIAIDAKANKLYVRKSDKLLWSADVSVGRGGVLKDRLSGRKWEFATPRGEFVVLGKARNPSWRKPDWAYVEMGEPVPPPEDPARFVPGELGDYVLNLGNGYLIHGTKREELLGRPASHGCVRIGKADLERLYETVPTGTRVFIFQ